jgi:uncharacterized membrane protein
VVFAPFALSLVLLLFLALVALIILVQLRVLAYAYRKIGVRPRYVFMVMVLSLLGSWVNIPLYTVNQGATVVAINVGGALIPVLVSIYLALHTRMFGRMLAGTAIVAGVVHSMAQIVPGVGIAVPILIPPLLAAGVGLLLAFRRAPPVAYVAGAMGTLVGADLLNLPRIHQLGAPVLSIGGAGTFDGIFLTGIIAGLLA